MLTSDMLALSAALLSDPTQAQWTNTILLPYAKLAHAELELALFGEGFREVEELTASLTIPVGTTSFTTAAILPADFIQPLSIKTRLNTSEPWSQPIEEVDINTDLSETQGNVWGYCFRENDIKVNPASVVVYGLLAYRKSLNSLTSASSNITTPLSMAYYSHKTAALASAFNGVNVERGLVLGAEAEKFKRDLINIEVRNQQGVSYRRKRFGSGRFIGRVY